MPESQPAVLWMDDEPGRLRRDTDDMQMFGPSLTYIPPNSTHPHGGWHGVLPMWPFDRSEPQGLAELLTGQGVEILLAYSAAHPIIPPTIWPLSPRPTHMECTQAAWHVAPQGSLCLLQSQGQWQPEANITDLLLKAAGWHVEYALMKAGLIERMTTNGIVNDPTLDDLIASASETSHAEAEESTHG